jgi:hypothetical protein
MASTHHFSIDLFYPHIQSLTRDEHQYSCLAWDSGDRICLTISCCIVYRVYFTLSVDLRRVCRFGDQRNRVHRAAWQSLKSTYWSWKKGWADLIAGAKFINLHSMTFQEDAVHRCRNERCLFSKIYNKVHLQTYRLNLCTWSILAVRARCDNFKESFCFQQWTKG